MIFFKPNDFDCPCCRKNEMNPIIYEKIEKIRSALGYPLYINSGFRCVKHNEEVGGKADSQHLIGKAIDVSTANMTNEIRHAFSKYVHSEFNGIGMAKNFIHMDIREQRACWVYS